MFKSIFDWFKSFFGSSSVKAAKLAGLFIAANNKDKVQQILPWAKAGLLTAEKGQMDKEAWEGLFEIVQEDIKDPKLKLIISEFVDVPAFTFGEANEDAVKILEAFILGLEAGV
jgi:hypothetical protein